MKTASSEALEEATLNARPERTARIAEGVTFSSDLQVFQAVGRTAAFWRRASRIYFGYKSAQAQAAFLGYPGQTAKDKFWQRHHAWAGAEMYSLAVDLRGFYLKVGQFLGARGDFVPMPICQQLSLLHDQVPPMTPEKTKEVIEQRLGKPIDAVFAWIDLGAPLGSASIAQVHKAKLKYSGTIVAVKVQYPDSLNVMLQDLANVRVAVAFLSKTELKFDLVSAVDELAAQIKLEFDFEREARVMDSIAEHLKVMKSAVAVPQSIPGLVTKDILVMTFLEGEQISRLKDHTAGLSVFERTQAAQLILSRICEAYGRMLLLQGLFQADCHPGNILVMKGGRIAILDYGQSKQLPPRDRLALANLVVALVDKDTLRISQTMDKLGVKTSTADPAVRAKMGYAMFDTRLKVDPFAADSPLKQTSVDDFPPDLFFVLRVVQLIRGLAVSMGVEDFSSASQWKPFAQEALQLRQKELKRSNWRKAYSADTWFSEGGIMPGGRSGKDASWYRSLRKPAWGLPTYLFRPVWCVLYILMAMSATLIYNQPEPITGTVKKQVPLFLFSLQLASNLAWNLCFFKLRNPSLALKCASLFLGLLCTTTITFHWILPSSAVLLLPALGWAVLLFAWNHSVWRNNRVGTPNATLRTLVQKVQQRQADMGGTMIDEEDMAWGEQARIAVEHEANMSQGRGRNPKTDPQSATGSNHIRCLPEEEDLWSLGRRPYDRTAFLGRSLHQHQNSRRVGLHGCKAVPSCHGCQVSVDDSEEISSMVPLDNLSQRCRSNNSSNSRSSSGGGVRMNDASKGSDAAEMHSRRQQQHDCHLQNGSSQSDYRLQGSHSRSRHQWQKSQQHSMHGTHSRHGSREHSSKVHSTNSSWAHSMLSSRQGSSPRCSSDSNTHSMQSVRHRCQQSVYSCNCWGEMLASNVNCQHASQILVRVSQRHATRSQTCIHHCNNLPRTPKAASGCTLARGGVHASDRARLSQAQVVPAFGSIRLAERGHVRRAGLARHMLHANAANQLYSKTV
ncbi:TPA: hypothetical protein ACH3X1_007180 [Trebouxia sp. C0004]